MAYNPGVQDRSGELLAQGISQGFSSLTQGVERYYKKKEEKEILDSTVSSLMSRASTSPKLAQFIGVDMSDEKAVRAGVIAAGAGDIRAGARSLGQSLQQFGVFERQDQQKRDEQKFFSIGANALYNGKNPYAAVLEAGGNVDEAMGRSFSSMVNDKTLADQRTAEVSSGKIFTDSVALNTDTDGNVDVKGLADLYIQKGGNLNVLNAGLTALSSKGVEADFTPTVVPVNVGGSILNTIRTSRNSVQVIQPPETDKGTATQKDVVFKEKEIAKVAELMGKGETKQALIKARALDMRDNFNAPVDLNYLGQMFPSNPPVENPGNAAPVTKGASTSVIPDLLIKYGKNKP
jgi:hypothetical protein